MTRPAEGFDAPAWLEPADAERHWQRDLAHFPGQLTELDADLLQRFIEGGFRTALASYSIPFVLLVRRLWTYYYQHEGTLPLPDEERAAMLARSAPLRERARTTIGQRWRDEWLPAIEEHLAFWAATEPTALGREALTAHLDATLARADALWDLHFDLAVALMGARRAYVELYQELFEPDSPLEGLTLLSGFDVLTTRAARALWPLRELVTEGPVRAALLSVAPRDAWTALQHEPAARSLVDALEAYLEAHGHRCPYVIFSAPSLREDPASVMSMLRHMVERPEADPNRLHAQQAEKRERAEAEVRARLRFYPAPVRDEFAARLAAAQAAAIVGEDHNYLIDYTSSARVRQVFLACGAALARAGSLDQIEDVLHLRVEEVRAALRMFDGETRDALSAPLKGRVAERRAEMARYADLDPPFEVNAPAPAEPDGASADAGSDAGPIELPAPNELRGSAASAGIARGRARVLRSLGRMGDLQPGEVLVAPTTGQAWTPLFATAAALVTESGNALSHAAVVAREYGLPAVVAVPRATTLIDDGALVEVDGAGGVVRLLERP